MGRFKTLDERLAKGKKKNNSKRAELCKKGHHQESTDKPGVCAHCGVKKVS